MRRGGCLPAGEIVIPSEAKSRDLRFVGDGNILPEAGQQIPRLRSG
jgi:hypothetical protein